MGFMGYKRDKGRAGIRNYTVVMSSVSCSNGVVNAIGKAVPEVKAITHTEGCGRGVADLGISNRVLKGIGNNPNVGALLIIGLGCEFIKASSIAEAAALSGKPVEYLTIQECGGSKKTTEKGIKIARKFTEKISLQKRVECDWKDLYIGLECGGSDAMSGVTANPMVGASIDWHVSNGGSAFLAEITEMTGTEKILASRAASEKIGEKIKELIQKQEELADIHLGPFKNISISPGNMDGGLTNVREKSLGCIIKGGTSTINEVIEYGAEPSKNGLIIMDTPGSDIFSLTGMAAGGAQMMIFTTGRGTPVGCIVAPTIKIATNSKLFENLNDDMDINAGSIIEGVSLEDASSKLNDLIIRIANGEKTKAEENLQDVFAIHTVGPAF